MNRLPDRTRTLLALLLLLLPALLISQLVLTGGGTMAVAAPRPPGTDGSETPAEYQRLTAGPTDMQTTALPADGNSLISRPQIVGGEPALPAEIPWQVALISGGQQFCGGTIIATTWIATAAHCVRNGSTTTPASSIQILAGSLSLSPYDSGYQLKQVAQVIVHESYNANTMNNDIALLRLSTALTFDTKVQSLTLIDAATASYAGTGAPALVSGWGDLGYMQGNYPNELRRVIVPIVDQATCNTAYGDEILAGMLCAGYMEGGRDSCQGDSGGPLAVPVADGWRLAGIVSWGNGCADPGFPGIYTRVTSYRAWVEGKVSALVPTAGPSPTAASTATTGPTATVEPTLEPTPLPPTAEPLLDEIRNGDFEDQEDVGWSQQSSQFPALIYQNGETNAIPPKSGSYAAWLGGGDNETSILSQALITGQYGGVLSYAYRYQSQDVCYLYDEYRLTAEILGPAPDGGPQPAAAVNLQRVELCSSKATGAWATTSVSLEDFGNAIVKIGFEVETDPWFVSSVFVDDVSYEPFVERIHVPYTTR